MMDYFNEVILPYIKEKRSLLKLSCDQAALFIFDNFKAQCTSSFLKLIDEHNVNVVLIPPNCTDRLQPLDLNVNLRSQFRQWYAKELCSQLDGHAENKTVDFETKCS